MNDYTNPSTNTIPPTWSTAAQQPINAPTSFQNYTLPTKWATNHTSSQSSTPTNPNALNTAFPTFSGAAMPGLYPSISAQSSNSIQGGAPSPFGPPPNIATHSNGASGIGTPTNATSATAYSFAATTQPLTTKLNAASTSKANTSATTTNTTTTTAPTTTNTSQSISQSSSTSSLTALTGGMGKLHINTSYNPYTAYAGGHTPTGNNSQANTPNPSNSNIPTPRGFGFNYNYSSIATPPTPANGIGLTMGTGFHTPRLSMNAANSLQTTAAMNNLNYRMNVGAVNAMRGHTVNTAAIPTLSANNSLNALPNLSNPPSINNLSIPPQQLQQLHTATTNTITPNVLNTENKDINNNNNKTTSPQQAKLHQQAKLNSNAASFEPSKPSPREIAAIPPPPPSIPSTINTMKSQQLAHQQKAEHVPYSYPSYAEAVNKMKKESVATTATPNNPATATVATPSNTTPNKASDGATKTDDGSKKTEDEAMQKLNPATWPNTPRHAKFYVIKSFGEDDVHKSIKYNLWCSTERGNRKLDEAFNESKRISATNLIQENNKKIAIDPRDTSHGCPVYLFFSVNRSGCFCGMAQMISNYYKDRHFGSWVQDGKWQGSFIVKWIYVKDIPNKDLKDITLPNNDNRPVTFSRDTQEIPFEQGIEMLRRFIKYEPKTNILQDFKYYDDRERDIKHKRTQQMLLQQLQQQQVQQQANVNLAGLKMANAAHSGHAVVANNNNNVIPPQPTTNNMGGDVRTHGHNQQHQHQQHGQHQPQSGGRGGHHSKYGGGGRNNKYGGGNGQIEGYSGYNKYGNNNHRGYNNNNNNNYNGYNGGYNNNRRRYYNKNERNNGNQHYTNNYHGRYNANRYQSNNSHSQQGQYGNFQILKRNQNQNHQTPGNQSSNNKNNNNNNNNSGNNANDKNGAMDNNDNMSSNSGSPTRSRYNRNRNRWVPK